MRVCPQCSSPCDIAHSFCPGCGFPVGKLENEPDDPLVGRVLPGGYAVLELVGIGGMGRVYRAEQTALGRTVAVKVIHPHLTGEENTAARFITEARASSLLNHPNSVSVIDFGKSDQGELYLVMEFLRGKDLARVAYEEGPLSFRRIVRILVQVLAALSEAHHVGIIHRDLKPENIILEPIRQGGDFVKVVDFGLAKMREGTMKGITNPGIVCGTPEYMSPEQGRGDPLDARSDVYAVGVVLFQLLTGQLPFEAESPTQVVIMHLTEPAPDPRKRAPSRRIPDALAEVCLGALEKDVARRYPSADGLAEALEEALRAMEGPTVAPAPLGEVACAHCGAVWTERLKFCGECGRAMTATRPPTAFESDAVHIELPETLDEPIFPLPLRGRAAQLARLGELLGAQSARLGAAVVRADAGLGKSRLLATFADQARGRGCFVVSVGPDPYQADVGYHALTQAVRALTSQEEGQNLLTRPSLRAEARYGLMEIFGKDGEERPRLPSETRRFAVAEALRFALYTAGERHGEVLLTVDDLHLVDRASREAFLDVAEEPPFVAGALLLATNGSLDERLPEPLERIGLDTLDAGQVNDLFFRAGVTVTGDEGRTYAPLHLEQLLRFTTEHGGAAPTRLADIIAARVERLAPDARRVLHAISVAGNELEIVHLARFVRDGTKVGDALVVLEQTGMVTIQAGRVSACHPLFREVVLAAIPRAARLELHAAMSALADDDGLPLEARALHHFHAEHTFQALILLDRVAQRAEARQDYESAVLALRRGVDLARLELARGEIDDPERALFLFLKKLGGSLVLAGSLSDAEGVLREALDLAVVVTDAEERARVLASLAEVAEGRDRRQEAKAYLREALDIARFSPSDDLSLRLEELRDRMSA